MDAATRRALFGTDEPAPPTRRLRAGPLEVRLCGTRLAGVSAFGHEAWHGVAFLYRDTDWGTPEPLVDTLEVDENAGGFSVRVRAQVPTDPPIDVTVTIGGDASGQVRYEGTAIARGDIDTHRCGLCLLHPDTLAGRPLQVLHDDGRTSDSCFPSLITPWPPFVQVRALRHEFADGRWAQAVFDGDVFEFEDQRNNADASFKTYNRSNLMPRPYRLRAGVPVKQSVVLGLVPAAFRPAHREHTTRPTLTAAPLPRPFPLLALAIDAPAAGDEAQAALARLRPPQLHLALDTPGQRVDWARLASWLGTAAASLRLDVAGIDEARAGGSLRELAGVLQAHAIAPESVAVFPSTPAVMAAARNAFPQARVGGGTRDFFTQLNRIEDLGPVDFLAFTTSALVHGADDESVLLGLRCVPAMLATLAARHPGRAIRVGPSGIAARRSPLGRLASGDGRTRRALVDADPRSRGLFGAAWLLGHVLQFARAGAQAVSLLALAGRDGLLGPQGRPVPAFFVFELLARARILRAASHAGAGQPAWMEFEDGQGHVHRLAAHLGLEPAPADPTACGAPPGATWQRMDAPGWLDFAAGRAASPWQPHDPTSGVATAPLAITWAAWRALPP